MNPRRPWRYRPATNRNRRAIEDPAGRSATQHRCRATLPYHAVRAGCNPLVMAVMAARSFPRQPLPGAYRCLSGPRLPARSPPDEATSGAGHGGREAGARGAADDPLPRRGETVCVRQLAPRQQPSPPHRWGAGWGREVASVGGKYADPRGAVGHPLPIPDVSASASMLHCAHRAGGRLAAHHAGVASRIPQLQYVALGAATWGSDQPAPQR